MKAVLLSIRPEWCELIASGKKTIEVRKTKPKINTPFKCYIYQSRTGYISKSKENDILVSASFGKVIGEFTCDCVKNIFDRFDSEWWEENGSTLEEKTCLSTNQIMTYAEHKEDTSKLWGKKYVGFDDVYMWYISDLKIYDKTKELSDFKGLCKVKSDCFACPYYDYRIYDCVGRTVTRPPQSWMYVEALHET